VNKKIWISKKNEDLYIDYKLNDNKFVLSFSEEIENFERYYSEHLFKIEESNSGLRFTLTVVLNPKLCYRKNNKILTKILGRECEVLSFPHSMTKYCFDKGSYIKTLKMNREDSINQAIKLLQSHGLSGYVLSEDVLTRYTNSEFEAFMESVGL